MYRYDGGNKGVIMKEALWGLHSVQIIKVAGSNRKEVREKNDLSETISLSYRLL